MPDMTFLIVVSTCLLITSYFLIDVIREYVGRMKLMTTRMELLYKGLEDQTKQIKILQFAIADLRDAARKNANQNNETMAQLIEAVCDDEKE